MFRLVDSGENKGKPIRTLEVTDPNVRGKQTVVRVIPFSVVFFIVSLGYLAFVFSKDDPYFQMLYFLMLIFFVSSSFVMYLFFNSYFGRTWQKIVIYENGIQFPNYLWDRIKGNRSSPKSRSFRSRLGLSRVPTQSESVLRIFRFKPVPVRSTIPGPGSVPTYHHSLIGSKRIGNSRWKKRKFR